MSMPTTDIAPIPADDEVRDPRGRDIVLALSYESIGDIVRRGFARPPDRLLAALLGDRSVHKLMIVSPFRSRLVTLAKRLLGRRDPELPNGHGAILVQPLRLARTDPTTIRGLERSYRNYDAIVEQAVREHGLVDPLFLTFHPMVAGFVPATWASSTTYYARDDWSELPAYAPWHDGHREAYKRIRRMKRSVVAVSQVLLDRLAPTGPGAAVANGVDVDEWTLPPDPPAWFADLPAPRFLYLGTLDDRLDLDAVRALSRHYSDGSIVLAGPIPEGSPVEQFRGPNIHFPGNQSRSSVVQLTRAADVCLLTHSRTELTQAMSPLKLYEYLAGGRPTVATSLPPIHGIDDRVCTYEHNDGVVAAAERALVMGPMTEPERLAFIEANSWANRHRAVMHIARGSTAADGANTNAHDWTER